MQGYHFFLIRDNLQKFSSKKFMSHQRSLVFCLSAHLIFVTDFYKYLYFQRLIGLGAVALESVPKETNHQAWQSIIESFLDWQVYPFRMLISIFQILCPSQHLLDEFSLILPHIRFLLLQLILLFLSSLKLFLRLFYLLSTTTFPIHIHHENDTYLL